NAREHRNLITKNGVTTEIHRMDWGVVSQSVEHIIFVELRPNAVSAWHMHERRTDYIFVLTGTIRIVLFDGRRDSTTYGALEILHSSRMRPTLLTIPPGVWHGFKNPDSENSGFLNFSDQAYNYSDPDEWRLPMDTENIPYRF